MVSEINADKPDLSGLIDRYQNLVFSVCYRITDSYFDAEDLTQDTFLSVYQNWDKFDGGNEKAWICRIATNKCLDYLKRAGRRMIPTEDTILLEIKSGEPLPEERILSDEVRRELLEACESLKEPYRSVALAYFYEEKGISQIAGETGKNPRTLQTQVYRARASLRKILRKGAEGI